MKVKQMDDFIKIVADEDKMLYWNFAFMRELYSQKDVSDECLEIPLEEMIEPGRKWQASPGYGWIDMRIPDNTKWEPIVTIQEGDDIRNYKEVEVK